MGVPKQSTLPGGQILHYSIGAVIERDGKYVLLDRLKEPFGFACPAGHVDEREINWRAMDREVYEETGYRASEEDFEYLRTFDWSFPEVRVLFPTYRLKPERGIEVKLNSQEHREYRWVTPEECARWPNLIHGFKDLLEKIYNVT